MSPTAELVPKSIKEEFLKPYPIGGLEIYDALGLNLLFTVPDDVTVYVDTRKMSRINSQFIWNMESLRTGLMKYVFAIEVPGSTIDISHESDGTVISSQPATTNLLQLFYLEHIKLPIRFSLEPHTRSAYIAVDNNQMRDTLITVEGPMIFRAK
jgi:hypothetical protein